MARKGIREYHAKQLLGRVLPGYGDKLVLVDASTDLGALEKLYPWLKQDRLVVKPDQLFGKRGKHGLIGADLSLAEVTDWIKKRIDTSVTVSGIEGTLTHFLIEPFVEHKEEYYVAMRTAEDKDIVYLCPEGGICIEENWDRVSGIEVPDGQPLDRNILASRITEMFPEPHKEVMTDFVARLYEFFVEGHFTYLEINPLTIAGGEIKPLDLVAKVDDTASFECQHLWGHTEMPIPFGREFSPEEKFIEELDAKTGASLKLSILNPKGRIWTMVAGGGASVIFADTISDLGHGKELANYGEYSGNPTTEATYNYAKTIFDMMTRDKDPQGRNKILFIGGGIANFTDVAKTFTGIFKAMREYSEKMRQTGVEIWVRRAGPNYKLALKQMKSLGDELKIPTQVYGPETHMTNIVSMALK